MNMLMICYNEAMDLEVMESLEACCLKNYTKICGAYGRGTSSGTHLGNDIWPGQNNILYIACGEEQCANLLAIVKKLRQQLGHEGIKAFSWKIEEETD